MKIFILFSVFLAFTYADNCNFPPRLWCTSQEIARQCKVEEQCGFISWPSSKDKVNFELYYESLCPDCTQFITYQLGPTFKAIGDIMNLTLVPYGNAMEEFKDGQWQFTCQHGPDECYGNFVETCALHLIPKFEDAFEYIYCIESSRMDIKQSVITCANKLSVDFGKIRSCVNSTLGNNLAHQMAVKTDALNPPHQYVPWVVLNGVHNEEIQNEAQTNLKKLICDTYKGPKPEACTEKIVKKKHCNRF